MDGAGCRRLSVVDLAMLRLERPSAPQHVAGLCVVEAGPLLDGHGDLALGAIRERLERRLVRVPELRQVLRYAPPLCGPPLWVDDPGFAIGHHVRTARVAVPGDEAALLETAERLLRDPLDRSRPLWDLWLLTGLTDGPAEPGVARVGLLFRVHHALVDGLAAVALAAAFLDADPEAPDPPVPAWRPAPPPSALDLFLDNARHRLSRAASVLADPAGSVRTLLGTVSAAAGVLSAVNVAPRTSLNASTGGQGRLLRVVRLGLDEARRVAHAHGATVNDVVLATVMGGVRDLLLGRGEPVDGLELSVVVPATIRDPGRSRDLGNAVGALYCRLPAGESDPVRRLALVAAATRAAKAAQPLSRETSTVMYGLLGGLSALGLDLEGRQRAMNFQVSDVRGPERPLYLLGAQVVDAVPVTGITGNLTLAVAALSYRGRLGLTVLADRRACPDVDVLADGMRRAWAETRASTPEAAGTRG
ncbi:wax ester/triacylglycerol synthase family O-acyltransferase [Nonomuraea sp. SMC257]|uniref:Diacylglycerol O-acyltransferase n=1 Tax=Nonomuraea montanisoli TaxID=2741721 RepID=A0A7Y6IHF6_9ACTN|nr:wax ester/triacylglycerol synthase family O-acyltransferase [Nonomuraea montanisoli]NUW37690.1 wax ester/triacylglycerol synthase family O-acyltransferase [Nonomuraea montanisoli]